VKIALIHNPNAFCGKIDGNDLCREFERVGHDLTYINTKQPEWERGVSPEIAHAIIAGGDETVRLVAPHLKGTPFSILPFGTANNLAQCLRQTSDTELLASQLDQAEIHSLDVGKVTHGCESKFFLEAAGIGVFAELMLAMRKRIKRIKMEGAKSRKQKFAHALEQLQRISRQYEGVTLGLKTDEIVIEDRFLLMAVMNIELIGPRLHPAPRADPSDGYLDIVLVRERNRESFCRWIERQSPGEIDAADLESLHCRRVEIRASKTAPVQIDSQLIQKPKFPLFIELDSVALEYAVVKGKRS
jgi:diacylglycerol kinase (ATP)